MRAFPGPEMHSPVLRRGRWREIKRRGGQGKQLQLQGCGHSPGVPGAPELGEAGRIRPAVSTGSSAPPTPQPWISGPQDGGEQIPVAQVPLSVVIYYVGALWPLCPGVRNTRSPSQGSRGAVGGRRVAGPSGPHASPWLATSDRSLVSPRLSVPICRMGGKAPAP